MVVGRAERIGRLTSVASVLAATAVLMTTASADGSHLAHAAQAERVSSVVSGSASALQDLAAQRAQRLRQAASEVASAAQSARLADHQRWEKESGAAIVAEAERLRNLTKFAWPTEGGISSGFGMRRHPILGYVRLHNGADIGGACGNPIIAGQSGTVTRAGYSRSSGNNVRIDHDRIEGVRVETAYLHMSRLVVRAGQKVAKGELIGYVGSTGLSTACHLHLALYKNAKGSDPLEYLQQS